MADRLLQLSSKPIFCNKRNNRSEQVLKKHFNQRTLLSHLHPTLKLPKCVSSVLKDGQILSIAVSNSLVYTGSDSNIIRIWKLPDFTECGQLKTKACMVVALEVSSERVYAAYGDGKIRCGGNHGMGL
ncbi:protein JINGUBANG [Fagus crenata]